MACEVLRRSAAAGSRQHAHAALQPRLPHLAPRPMRPNACAAVRRPPRTVHHVEQQPRCRSSAASGRGAAAAAALALVSSIIVAHACAVWKNVGHDRPRPSQNSGPQLWKAGWAAYVAGIAIRDWGPPRSMQRVQPWAWSTPTAAWPGGRAFGQHRRKSSKCGMQPSPAAHRHSCVGPQAQRWGSRAARARAGRQGACSCCCHGARAARTAFRARRFNGLRPLKPTDARCVVGKE